MVARRAYSRVKVKQVDVAELVSKCAGIKSICIGLDVGKLEILACLRWGQESFERPWRVDNPFEIEVLVALCVKLSKTVKVEVALESTGTYGDAVRSALTDAKIPIVRVSGKHVSDYSEIFDGVPSQHDGKDAAMIAELAALGKSAPWAFVFPSEQMAQVRYHVKCMDCAEKRRVAWIGKLESHVSRHWPELTRELKLTGAATQRLLAKYGSPSAASADPELAKKLRAWGPRITPEKADRIVDTAKHSSGIRMDSYDTLWMKDLAINARAATLEVRKSTKAIKEILNKDSFWSKYIDSVGAGTLGVILTTVGDPRNYPNAGSLLKALGLNLKERSSGKRIGEKAISKRGSALARRWLYFWALRSVKLPELKEWYFRFHSREPGQSGKNHRKMKGLVCLMRKLMRSLWRCVCDGAEFDIKRVIGPKKSTTRKRRRRTNKAAHYPQP